MDGDIESNPGPEDPMELEHPDAGALFLAAQRTSSFLALAHMPPTIPANLPTTGDNRRTSSSNFQTNSNKGKKRSLSEQPGQMSADRAFCCFPTCPCSSAKGGRGWVNRADAIKHVANAHVACGDIPSQGWLVWANRWICGHCLSLQVEGHPCKGENCFRVVAADLPSRWIQQQPRQIVPNAPTSENFGVPLHDTWDKMNLLNDICGSYRPLLRHIPKGVLSCWASGLTKAIDEFLQHQTWESLARLLAYPKVTLGVPHRSGRAHKSEATRLVRKQVQAFATDWLQAWNGLKRVSMRPAKKQCRDHEGLSYKVNRLENPAFLNTLQGLMDDGAFSKAVKHLLSDGVHDAMNEEVRQKLQELHPRADPPQFVEGGEPWPWDDTTEGKQARLKQLRFILLNFPPGSAGGPSGLRPQHLQDVLRHDVGMGSSLLAGLDSFVRFCLDGKLPKAAAPFLCGAQIVPLRKPTGKMDIRPVAVGETLRRIVAKFAMSSILVKRAIEELRPLQCGVAVEGACETVAMALQGWVDANRSSSDWAVLQVDLRNAFNSMDRGAMLRATLQHVPELLPWVTSCYGCHSQLFANGHRIQSEVGVQQGDPLGPLLFSLGWHQVVKALPTTLSINVWYLDDGHIVGDAHTLAQVVDTLALQGLHLGVQLNLSKCKVWGPSTLDPSIPEDQFGHFRHIPRVPWGPDGGLKVLGLPVEYPGSSTFRASVLREITGKLAEACSILSHLGDPQTQHLLLRHCLDACRLIHFLRGVDCRELQDMLLQASASIKDCFGDILGKRSLNECHWQQCTLPLRLAGLGIKDPLTILPAARVAATLCFLKRGFELSFPATTVVLPPDWATHLVDLQSKLGTSVEPVASWLRDGQVRNVEENHRQQKWWSLQLQKAQAKSIVQTAPLRDRCRLALQNMPHTTAWMNVVPNEGLGNKMAGPNYRLLLRWWLGMPLVEGSATECPCCGEAMDVFGDHLVSCGKNQLTRRHHALRDALTEVLRAHNVAYRKEVAIGGRSRPADVALLSFDARGPLAVDLVVHHPLAPGVTREEEKMKSSLSKAEEEKMAESEALCHANGWLFSPLGWHPWSGVGPKSWALLRRLEKFIAGDLQGWARQKAIQSLFNGLSFALMNFVAQQLHPALQADCNMSLPELAGQAGLGHTPPTSKELQGPTFQPMEELGWAESREPRFVGPIRLSRR